MDSFTKLTGVAAPMPLVNIDTDMLIPKQFLKTIKRTGLGVNLFEEMRYDRDGNENPDFVLNKPQYRNAQILVAGDNFGCGSSREHAPWALLDFGIRVVIAPSFADIFFNNCFKNGILPIVLPQEEVDMLDGRCGEGVQRSPDRRSREPDDHGAGRRHDPFRGRPVPQALPPERASTISASPSEQCTCDRCFREQRCGPSAPGSEWNVGGAPLLIRACRRRNDRFPPRGTLRQSRIRRTGTVELPGRDAEQGVRRSKSRDPARGSFSRSS